MSVGRRAVRRHGCRPAPCSRAGSRSMSARPEEREFQIPIGAMSLAWRLRLGGVYHCDGASAVIVLVPPTSDGQVGRGSAARGRGGGHAPPRRLKWATPRRERITTALLGRATCRVAGGGVARRQCSAVPGPGGPSATFLLLLPTLLLLLFLMAVGRDRVRVVVHSGGGLEPGA